ncbi:MAG: transporter [Acidobacteria bacterium]|nr:transporter [Acidobacteriota bacterium]
MEARTTSSDDLGLGRRVDEQAAHRLLNRDGSFNVERTGLPIWQSLHLFHTLIKLPWLRFNLTVLGAYLVINSLFALGFWWAGPGAVAGIDASDGYRLVECFFFSIQTFSTIGYGTYAPNTLAAHLLVSAEAVVGMFFVALATGIFFARFSQPNARVLFSRQAVIAPYRNGRAFMFRIANRRKSQLLEVQATVLFARRNDDRASSREFAPLRLERDKILFMPLHWVVVHPIDEESPLWGYDQADLESCDPEFLILLTATDETFSETVQTRASYAAEDIAWGSRFADIYQPAVNGIARVDLGRLSEITPAELPSAAQRP